MPPELESNKTYQEIFQAETPNRLNAMCRELPIEKLDLKSPQSSEAMSQAIAQVFGVTIYMASKSVPREYGDTVFPRLVDKVTAYDGSVLNLHICDLVRDLAVYLASSGRYVESARILRTLKASIFWSTWAQGDLCLFAALNNIAIGTKLHTDYEAALTAAQDLPEDQRKEFADPIKRLQDALLDRGTIAGIKRCPSRDSPVDGLDTHMLVPPDSTQLQQHHDSLLAEMMSSNDEAVFLSGLRQALALVETGKTEGVLAMRDAIRLRSGIKDIDFYKPGMTVTRGLDRHLNSRRNIIDLARNKAILKDPRHSGDLISALLLLSSADDLQKLVHEIFDVGGLSEGYGFQLIFNEMRCSALLKA